MGHKTKKRGSLDFGVVFEGYDFGEVKFISRERLPADGGKAILDEGLTEASKQVQMYYLRTYHPGDQKCSIGDAAVTGWAIVGLWYLDATGWHQLKVAHRRFPAGTSKEWASFDQDLAGLTNLEIQERLKLAGKSTTGNKKALLKRLLDGHTSSLTSHSPLLTLPRLHLALWSPSMLLRGWKFP